MRTNTVEPGTYWVFEMDGGLVAKPNPFFLSTGPKIQVACSKRGYWKGNLQSLTFISAEQELTNLYQQIDYKNKSVISQEHSFDVASSTCTHCGASQYDVVNGSGSWVCAAKTKSCCGKIAIDRWDPSKSEWNCSGCGATTSNDPNYPNDSMTNWQKPNAWEPFKAEPKVPKKCTCGAWVTTQPNKHSLWCDIR